MDYCGSVTTSEVLATSLASFGSSSTTAVHTLQAATTKSETFKTNIGTLQGAVLSHVLSADFVSEMFCRIEVEKFECSNDGRILISANTNVELDGRTRTALMKFLLSAPRGGSI